MLNPVSQNEIEQASFRKGLIAAATPIEGDANTATAIFKSSIRSDVSLQYLRLQNQTTTKVYVAFNDDASAAVYNYILKASTGTKDGSGGEFIFPPELRAMVTKVSLFCTASFVVSMLKVTNPNNDR